MVEDSILQPSDAHGALSRLEYDAKGMEIILGTALAIFKGDRLQHRLHLLSGAHQSRQFQVAGLVPNCWLRVSLGTRSVVTRVADPKIPTVDFPDALERDTYLSCAIRESRQKPDILAGAGRLLQLFTAPKLPDRRLVSELLELSPLLEQFSYKYAAHLIAFMNALRPELRSRQGNEREILLERYWSVALTAGRAILFASESGANSWLSDMAASIRSDTWTPSFPLTRERSLWLACCAAKSAAAFGTSVVERYFNAVGGAKNLVEIFDGLFGLIAIGLTHPEEAETIATELKRLSHRFKYRGDVCFAIGEAVRHLRDAGTPRIRRAAKRRFDWPVAGATNGFATWQFLCTDPIKLLDSRHVGFEVLPEILSAKVPDFFPIFKSEADGPVLKASQIEDIFCRAWTSARSAALTYH
jgi:hypothetical protein